MCRAVNASNKLATVYIPYTGKVNNLNEVFGQSHNCLNHEWLSTVFQYTVRAQLQKTCKPETNSR